MESGKRSLAAMVRTTLSAETQERGHVEQRLQLGGFGDRSLCLLGLFVFS